MHAIQGTSEDVARACGLRGAPLLQQQGWVVCLIHGRAQWDNSAGRSPALSTLEFLDYTFCMVVPKILSLEELSIFHAQRRQATVTITFEKSPVPMLWLDSAVLIDFAKIENNENIERSRATKLSRLRKATRKAVRAGKLVCPEWDQALEFEGKRLERQIRDIVSDLSCGYHCVPHAGIADQQIVRGMRAYLALANNVHIPPRDYFDGDPALAVREAKRSRFIVEATMKKPREWLTKSENEKLSAQRDLESLRKKCRIDGRRFEQQLVLERCGVSDVMLKMTRDFMKDVFQGKIDFWSFMGVQGFLSYQTLWEEMGGPGPGIIGVYSFMRSPYYWMLPIHDIECRLCADLIVGHSPVKIGDTRDVHNLATSIPVAHYVVADNAMVDRCSRLGLGAKWCTKLFSTKTLDDLCDELEDVA
jgi:hypothetical protein